MANFTIEKNIPIPPRGWGSYVNLLEMEIGDSYFVDSKTSHQAIRSLFKRNNMNITVRKLSSGGFRIWRTE